MTGDGAMKETSANFAGAERAARFEESVAGVTFVERRGFGDGLFIERYRLTNGLTVLLLPDPVAPVVSYHTWFRVGSSDELPGKTGQAHLLEHLMFNETKHYRQGQFDQLLEAAGGETNAATWLDWTYYYDNIPASELELVVRLESDRMSNLVLDPDRVASEKGVVMAERLDSVEDDVEGKANEMLLSAAFGSEHPYGWPTIGWAEDIESFSAQDCASFYAAHYEPGNATIVIAGDISAESALPLIAAHYGAIPRSVRRANRVFPASQPDRARRDCELEWPTSAPKISLAWEAPPYADYDHAVLSVLCQILTGGRSSRLWRELVRERELASEVRIAPLPFRHIGLVEMWIGAREEHSIDECLAIAERQIARLRAELVADSELDKVKARLELGFLGGMETASGKAEYIGMGETVASDPCHCFVRLEELRRVSAEDVRRVANDVFHDERRFTVRIVPREDDDGSELGDSDATSDEEEVS